MNQEPMDARIQSDDPAEIESGIARTRAELDDTLTEIQRQLSPDALLDQAKGYLRDHNGGKEFFGALKESVRRYPVPMAMIGIGVGWLMLAGRRAHTAHDNLPVPADQAGMGAPAAAGTSEAVVRDEVERHGATEEDRKARQQEPGSGLPRGL